MEFQQTFIVYSLDTPELTWNWTIHENGALQDHFRLQAKDCPLPC